MGAEKSMNVNDEYLLRQGNTIAVTEKTARYLAFKRFVDILFALTGLLAALPIMALFSILICLESPGPAFYKQERVGKNGRAFHLYKLRSMKIDAEKSGAVWALKKDPRVTKVGAFIRRTRIDELPQLLNVLRGEMSLIGPRPERPVFTKQFQAEIPGFTERLAVKPGLSGWAQVNGGYDMTPREKLMFDLYYIRNLTFSLEVKIMIKTCKVIWTGDGAR
ncbi:exopolysaccharide biosynthesis polyprenyl glycosylphosphotransferase [Bacillus sp. ISL-51]|uniref:exopolysaccharide biosynthesis polyprenyl glycosylphosphotransferase n=1 Tax=Bacteria TaxID=2 RepID=UPI001BE80370|nr:MULTISPECIES: exopolysaccharide biosynthesis polyprenyl glycosylphosphotransferase [unclassified Bacillus (in: firmicutes)]MBT2572886.1 exopolysaccharide biosynthesis polyprenyl glycosylphosphotransferase [Bacillus sp. ISL-51]MBT2635388.1 exopolysaccharide biosynthesis polyprenyl glycosylphosphotransferase [Bacillus sp. ISL-26]MBT2713359.1 exopolysaccharide biosynthesis polyprenyl glycosylphosphotransferase [Pseudomonas sp. ISL-88]